MDPPHRERSGANERPSQGVIDASLEDLKDFSSEYQWRSEEGRTNIKMLFREDSMRLIFREISEENFPHGNSTWSKAYENPMETRRVPS